jgi:hypothetical protein
MDGEKVPVTSAGLARVAQAGLRREAPAARATGGNPGETGAATVVAMNQNPRPVEELVAEHRADGFVVVESTSSVITLERTNSWASFLLGVVVGGIGGGLNPSPRRQRLYLHVEDRVAIVGLHP